MEAEWQQAIYLTSQHEPDGTQGQFLSGLIGMDSDFSFGCYIKIKKLTLPYYLTITGGTIVGSIPLSRLSAQ